MKLYKYLKESCSKIIKDKLDRINIKISLENSLKNSGNSLRTCYSVTIGSSKVSLNLKIVNFNTLGVELGNGFAFRNWTYIIIFAKLDSVKIVEDIYIDIGCGVSLIDRE